MPRLSSTRAWQIRIPVWPLLLVTSIAIAGARAQSAPNQAAGSASTNRASKSKAAEKKATQNAGESSVQAPDVLVQLNGALEGLAAKVSSGVVQILVTGYGPAHEENRSQTALIVRQHAVGSGVIVDADGYIVTNAHVIEGAQRIRVVLPIPVGDAAGLVPVGKRRIREARLLGFHKETDLALLKIEDKELPTLPFVRHERPHVGQLVFAIGSPEGLQNSVTMGVISAVAQQPDPSKPMTYIQTDAPINPGNSGGPLVDMNGTVVGINTFILSAGGGSEGLGFAVPAPIVEFVYRSLRKYGHVHRVEIGAGLQEITPTLAEGLHLPQPWGVLVDDVKPDGPAAGAGLQIQDIVLSADDRRVETLPSITAALYLHPLDRVLKLEVLRGHERKTIYVPAVEHHDSMDQLLDAVSTERSLIPRLGILAIDFTADLSAAVGSLRIPSGVLVVGRAADLLRPETGLQAGDVIHQLNTTPIQSMEALQAAVRQLKAGDSVALQVERDNGLRYESFEME